MLFQRNYFELTQEEVTAITKAKDFYQKATKRNKGGLNARDLFNYHNMVPPAYYHVDSLFPNNYILFNYEQHGSSFKEKSIGFQQLIESNDSTEREILNYIKETESYFILESLLHQFNTGNHDAYLFREFKLAPNFIVDFLLVGKNSGGYEFIFIEFESPNIQITLKDGSFGTAFRNGLKQIEDWDLWIDSGFSSLKNVFKIYKNSNADLPEEFYELDKTRIHYVVVAGKRKDFNSKTYRLKRKGKDGTKILHYDNVLDALNFYVAKHEILKK